MKRVVTGSNASTASVAHDTNLFGGEGSLVSLMPATLCCHSACEDGNSVDVCEMERDEQ